MDVFARDSGFISGCPAYGPDPVLRPPAMALEHPGSTASHALPNPELDTVASEACRRLARSPATKSSLSAACCTTAAAILQKVLQLKLISGAAYLTPIGFLGGNAPAAIGRDISSSLDWLGREQTEPSYRTTNPKRARGHCSCIAANSRDVSSN